MLEINNETITIDFNVEKTITIGGNKKTYFIGQVEGVLSYSNKPQFVGFEFVTNQGYSYFIG